MPGKRKNENSTTMDNSITNVQKQNNDVDVKTINAISPLQSSDDKDGFYNEFNEDNALIFLNPSGGDDDEKTNDLVCSNEPSLVSVDIDASVLEQDLFPQPETKTSKNKVSKHFKPKSSNDLCTCAYQTIMRGHHGPCGNFGTMPKKEIYDYSREFNNADLAYKRVGTDVIYTYQQKRPISNPAKIVPLMSDPKEVSARVAFIECLAFEINKEKLTQVIDTIFGIKPLIPIIMDYTSCTSPELCAENWFATLPIRGARHVAWYAFKYESLVPVVPKYCREAKQFREQTIVIMREKVNFVKVMRQCLAINFDAMRTEYRSRIATPPCHPNPEFDQLLAQYPNDDKRPCSYEVRLRLHKLYGEMDLYDHHNDLHIEITKWQMIQRELPKVYLERMRRLRRLHVLAQ